MATNIKNRSYDGNTYNPDTAEKILRAYAESNPNATDDYLASVATSLGILDRFTSRQ